MDLRERKSTGVKKCFTMAKAFTPRRERRGFSETTMKSPRPDGWGGMSQRPVSVTSASLDRNSSIPALITSGSLQ